MLHFPLFTNLKPMFSKKLLAATLGVASISVLILAILNFPQVAKIIPMVKEVEITNSISGKVGSDGPVLIVKIDDTPPARPQIGLEVADLVYIEQVEGGLTRLAAVFSSQIPVIIGPVRSARISDIEIMQQFGRVAFAYSGAQSKLLPVIAAADVENFGAQRQGPDIYANDPLRNQPVAMILQAKTLMDRSKSENLPIAISKNMGWNFGEAPETGTPIAAAKVSWPASSYGVTWSESENRWLLDNRGVPDLAASGEQLGASTFVVQLVSITPSEYGDKFGGVTPFTQTTGTGRGYILRDGKAIAGIWSRISAEAGTTWKTLAGEEIRFAAGQIWIALTDKEPDFTPVKVAIAADAPSTSTK